MLDLGLLRRRAFSGAATMIAMFGFALAGVMFALTQLLQLVLGYGPLKAGLALLPVAVSAGAAMASAPRWSRGTAPVPPWSPGSPSSRPDSRRSA